MEALERWEGIEEDVLCALRLFQFLQPYFVTVTRFYLVHLNCRQYPRKPSKEMGFHYNRLARERIIRSGAPLKSIRRN